MADWRKPEICDALAVLYLRLAGYFTTGFVAHSPTWGKTRTDIDCLAVRHSYHSHPDIQVPPPAFLSLSAGQADLLICEVKSNPQSPGFNRSLCEDGEVLGNALRWSGLLSDKDLGDAVSAFPKLLDGKVRRDVALAGIVVGKVRLRALLVVPPLDQKDCQDKWWLVGDEIFRFIAERLNPLALRQTCSTHYNYGQWGRDLSPLVKYIKSCESGPAPTLDGLYQNLGCR